MLSKLIWMIVVCIRKGQGNGPKGHPKAIQKTTINQCHHHLQREIEENDFFWQKKGSSRKKIEPAKAIQLIVGSSKDSRQKRYKNKPKATRNQQSTSIEKTENTSNGF